jgi:hypothetical protein
MSSTQPEPSGEEFGLTGTPATEIPGDKEALQAAARAQIRWLQLLAKATVDELRKLPS